MSEFDPAVRTRTLARIVGPYFLVVGVVLLTRQQLFATMLPEFMHQPGLVLVTGAFTLLAGLTLMAAHHHWTGPTAIFISLLGIGASLKGAWLMLAPEWGADVTNAFVASPAIAMMAAGVVELLIGAWLTFVGWFARKSG